MRIDELWNDMEAESPSADTGWTTRYALPHAGHPILVAIEKATRARALLVPVRVDSVPLRKTWPVCRGLDLAMLLVRSESYLCVRLRDQAAADVFTALAEDVAPRVAEAADDAAAVLQLFARLEKWQLFLAAGRDGLGTEEQRGLFGELYVLAHVLAPQFGPRVAIESWKAPAATHQDFQFGRGAVEVKTTAAKQPQTVRITSERQLDDTGVGVLLLHVLIVDDREVPANAAVAGQTLADMVAAVRTLAGTDAFARAQLDDRLLRVGWLDAHVDRYQRRRLTLRSEHSYRVREGFPRLIESALPVGIGSVEYGLDLAVCGPFEVTRGEMLLELSRGLPS